MPQLPEALPPDDDLPPAQPLPDWAYIRIDDTPADDTPRSHGQVLASLGLVYLRHNDPARAMVLGLAAMSMGDLAPATILMVADAMLRAGDPEQALTVLERFDHPERLAAEPTAMERAARHYLTARVFLRRGEDEAAREQLRLSREIAATAGPAGATP